MIIDRKIKLIGISFLAIVLCKNVKSQNFCIKLLRSIVVAAYYRDMMNRFQSDHSPS